jgi:uncharacterized protein (DUF58 family)
MMKLTKLYKNRFRDRCLLFDKSIPLSRCGSAGSIDHFCTAKRGESFAKQFTGERDFDIIFAIDTSSSQMFESSIPKIDFALDFASGLSRIASEIGDRTGLLLFSGNMEHYSPACANLHVPNLKNRKLGTTSNPSLAITFLQRILKVSSVIFFISDFLYADKALEKMMGNLKTLSRRHEVVCLRLSDPFDRSLPSIGKLRLQDAETLATVCCDTGKENFSRIYAETSGKWAVKSRKNFRKVGLQFVSNNNGCNVEFAIGKCLDKRLAYA